MYLHGVLAVDQQLTPNARESPPFIRDVVRHKSLVSLFIPQPKMPAIAHQTPNYKPRPQMDIVTNTQKSKPR